ncbi:hypothetical protein B0H17DRAFT_1071603 [Mycena rosella]|uniref:F-box domain-containing protein n=1 Tax=Mycena rosella TaxID=1033263 RepID=A0AAD7DA53_MYCRO|nr:hypothetical protein B0H17DRAFT_1071603 [Mycena rosella]
MIPSEIQSDLDPLEFGRPGPKAFLPFLYLLYQYQNTPPNHVFDSVTPISRLSGQAQFSDLMDHNGPTPPLSPPKISIAPKIPPELWSQAFAFLHRHEDIASCALVSRSLSGLAQANLFREIDLGGRLPLDNGRIQGKFRRLDAVLADSPHLKRHVRSICVRLDLSVLTEIKNIFPGLVGLQRVRMIGHRMQLGPSVPNDVIECSHLLLALPSVSHVELFSVTFKDAASMSCLFSRCSPGLRALSLHNVRVSQTTERKTPVVDVASNLELVPFNLTHLSLVNSDSGDINKWLTQSPERFNLHQLVELELRSHHNVRATMEAILAVASASIKRLTIAASSMYDGGVNLSRGGEIDLRTLPQLTYLAIHVASEVGLLFPEPTYMGGSPDPHNLLQRDVLAATAAGFPNAIEEIVLCAQDFQADSLFSAPPAADFLAIIDNTLPRLPLPHLRRFEVRVGYDIHRRETSASPRRSGKRCSPNCCQRCGEGLLVVTESA